VRGLDRFFIVFIIKADKNKGFIEQELHIDKHSVRGVNRFRGFEF
jgi:hypothetical protein